jgi:hypothetical protein
MRHDEVRHMGVHDLEPDTALEYAVWENVICPHSVPPVRARSIWASLPASFFRMSRMQA